MEKLPDDAELYEPDPGEVDAWEESYLVRRLTDDLTEVFVKPLDADAQSRHLAAISRAVQESSRKPISLSPPQRSAPSRSWSASGPGARPAPARVAPRSPSAGLSSPLGARRTVPPTVPARPPSPAFVKPQAPAAGEVVSLAGKRRSKLHPVELLNSMSYKAAAVVALIGLSSFGLAVAGQLPRPVQTAFSEAGDRIGLELPAPLATPQQPGSAPDRQQEVVVPPVELPQPAAPPSPQPVPSYAPAPAEPAPAASAPAPAAAAPQPAAPSFAPGSDFQTWLSELIRQAIATANLKSSGQAGTPAPKASTNLSSASRGSEEAPKPKAPDNSRGGASPSRSSRGPSSN